MALPLSDSRPLILMPSLWAITRASTLNSVSLNSWAPSSDNLCAVSCLYVPAHHPSHDSLTGQGSPITLGSPLRSMTPRSNLFPIDPGDTRCLPVAGFSVIMSVFSYGSESGMLTSRRVPRVRIITDNCLKS